jgi:hypothetical protein
VCFELWRDTVRDMSQVEQATHFHHAHATRTFFALWRQTLAQTQHERSRIEEWRRSFHGKRALQHWHRVRVQQLRTENTHRTLMRTCRLTRTLHRWHAWARWSHTHRLLRGKVALWQRTQHQRRCFLAWRAYVRSRKHAILQFTTRAQHTQLRDVVSRARALVAAWHHSAAQTHQLTQLTSRLVDTRRARLQRHALSRLRAFTRTHKHTREVTHRAATQWTQRSRTQHYIMLHAWRLWRAALTRERTMHANEARVRAVCEGQVLGSSFRLWLAQARRLRAIAALKARANERVRVLRSDPRASATPSPQFFCLFLLVSLFAVNFQLVLLCFFFRL